MPLAVKNDKSRGRYIFFKVNGVMKKEWFDAFEERIIQDISTADQLANKESAAKRNAITKAGPARAGLINSRGGFIKDISENDIFEGRISKESLRFTNVSIKNVAKNSSLVFINSLDSIGVSGTEFFNRTTNVKETSISGYYSDNDSGTIMNVSRGVIQQAYALSPRLSKPVLKRNFKVFLDAVNVTVSQAEINSSVYLMSATGSTGSTGTTVVTGDTGCTINTGTTTGTTTGVTTGVTTGTTTGVTTGDTGQSCYVVSDLLSFLSCYGSSSTGTTSGCSTWDLNSDGQVDAADLLTFLSNICYSGGT